MSQTTTDQTREFSLSAILSLVNGPSLKEVKLVGNDGTTDLRQLIGFMIKESDAGVADSTLLVCGQRCRDALLAQHPQLANIGQPEGRHDVDSWLAEKIERFGPTLEVARL